MTDENRQENVRLEWQRAVSALGALDAMRAGGFWADAVSKAYYAAFYMARALLFSAGLEARSHAGVVHLLSLHFVRAGKLPASLVRELSQMQQSREDADYQSALVFDEAAATEARDRVRRLQQAALSYLGQHGFLLAE